MDQLIGLLVAVPLLGATLVGLFVVMNALFTSWIARTCQTAETQAARSFLVGLVNLVFVGALISAVIALADGTGLDFLVVVAVLLAVVLAIATPSGWRRWSRSLVLVWCPGVKGCGLASGAPSPSCLAA